MTGILQRSNDKDPGIEIDKENKKIIGRKGDTEINREALKTSNHSGTRILFYEYGCEFCKEWLKIVPEFNHKLDRRSEPIRMIDINSSHPLVNGQDKMISVEGTPTLYMDGIVVTGVTSKGFAKGFLQGFLEDEMMIE